MKNKRFKLHHYHPFGTRGIHDFYETIIASEECATVKWVNFVGIDPTLMESSCSFPPSKSILLL
jgi:hypothetical protein